MASNLPNENIFDEICQQITDTFGELIKQLTDRRDQLLGEVRRRKSEFEERLNSQRESLEQLETVRIQIEQISLSQTQSSNLLQSSLAPIQKQISDLKTELTPNLKFECSLISSQLMNLGAVTVGSIDYSKKVKATHILELKYHQNYPPKVVHIDDSNLFVKNNRIIQIFRTSNWSFNRNVKFGENSSPQAVATNKTHCFISGTLNDSCWLYKFDICEFKLMKKQNEIPFKEHFSFGINLAFAILEDEIFVTANNSLIIFIFDLDLRYRRKLELPNTPRCIQVTRTRLYVLNELNSLHFFNNDGKLMGSSHEFYKSEITQDFQLIHSVNSFCFDPSGDALLVSNGRIIVVTPNGEEIYSVGKGSQCSEDISGCNSVAVFEDKLIVSCDRGYIKIF